MKFGIFYEHQLPRPWNEGDEHRLFQEALDQVELADRLGIDYAWEVEHHFLEEYSHSSAPEIFPRGMLAAHPEYPSWPWHLPDAAEIQSPGAGRGADRHARSRLQRPRRIRHRRERIRDGARRLQCRLRSGREAADVARGRRTMHQHDGDGPLSRLQGRVLRDAVPQRGAEAVAETASAALGRLLQPRDHQDGGAPRHRRADIRLCRSPRGPAMG